jgi:glutaminyl-tRNA synthetase
MTTSQPPADAPASNFLRQIVERDLAQGTYAGRRYGGVPGDAASLAGAPLDGAAIRTRFPPEPNGYLHVGHAKAITVNFGLAEEYGGACHLRFDDTNPEKEEQEYVDAIEDAVRWLGYDWGPNLHFASSYFDVMYRAAEALVEAGLAYVDEQTADEMRAARGDFQTPGTPSPFRDRSPAENLARLRQMKAGELADGAAVLRAKIDLASPNINLRDPTLYRIRRATHHATGDAWCIYPMYTYAHPIEDALERITHSVCTLEFEDQRPFYDWLLDHLAELGVVARPRPHQHEFARLNLTYVITSKRRLRQLVEDRIVEGWDDPRMPTLAGMRRRGYTPASIRTMCERAGTSKAGGWTEYASLEAALREDLDPKAPRAMAVLDPIRLELVNWADIFGSDAHRERCTAPAHPHDASLGERAFLLGPSLWIEREDFAAVPPKGFHRLFPGNRVRLRHGVVVECLGEEGGVVRASIVPDTRSGTPGADAIKVKGAITWLAVDDALPAEVRLYERLFTDPQPDLGGKDFLSFLNPTSRQTVEGWIEPSLATLAPEDRVQLERHGYFVADRVDHRPERPVLNRIATLRESR